MRLTAFKPMVYAAVLTGAVIAGQAAAQSVFINEIHYDNTGIDTGEFVEIAGPAGNDLTGWSLVLYNGNGGGPYRTTVLSESIPNQCGGFGTLTVSYPQDGIQNGSPDGLALVDNTGTVIQFLSYEGIFAAVGGPADGMTSADIGVAESSSTAVGQSLQLTGSGSVASDFTWAGPTAESPGACNTGQTFVGDGDQAPRVTSTIPTNGAIGAAVNSNITITFSEEVSVTASWFDITCDSGPIDANIGGGPTTFTLMPTLDLPGGESCTVTVFANQVSDQDTIDPPDNMAADFTFSFSTFPDAVTLISSVQGSGSSVTNEDAVTTIEGIVS